MILSSYPERDVYIHVVVVVVVVVVVAHTHTKRLQHTNGTHGRVRGRVRIEYGAEYGSVNTLPTKHTKRTQLYMYIGASALHYITQRVLQKA